MKTNLNDYAVLDQIGPHNPLDDRREYWITFAGHAHCQPVTGLSVGALGERHGQDFQ